MVEKVIVFKWSGWRSMPGKPGLISSECTAEVFHGAGGRQLEQCYFEECRDVPVGQTFKEAEESKREGFRRLLELLARETDLIFQAKEG